MALIPGSPAVFRLAPALVALTLFGGCHIGPLVRDSPDDALPADFPEHSVQQVLAQMAGATPRVRSFRTEANIQLQSPMQEASASAGFRGRGDTLYAVFRGPLGFDAARALVTADSFFFADQLRSHLYIGSAASAQLFLPGASTPGALRSMLLGLQLPDSTPLMAATDRHYILLERSETSTRRFTVDPATWRVVAYRETDDQGSVLSDHTYEAFDRIDGFVMARRAILTSPAYQTRMEIEHRRLDLNPAGLTLTYRPPRHFDTTNLDE